MSGFSRTERPPPDVVLRTGVVGASVTHMKFAASSVLPVPFQRATCGYRQSGLVRSTLPPVECDAIIFSGATPFSTHCSSAASVSN